MKPGIPWSVKGVEPELREIAKTAAKKSGMTLGEWLNSAINDQADAPETEPQQEVTRPSTRSRISTHPIDRAATRLEDIAEQLSRLARRDTETAPHYAPQPVEDSATVHKILNRVESNERQTVEAFTAINERLANMSRQVTQAVKAQPRPEEAPGFQALEKAVRNIVEHLEVSEKRTRDNLKSLQERMGDMATKATGSVQSAPAFSQLETRLSELARRVDQSQGQPVSGLPDLLRHELDNLAGRIETVHATAETLANRAQTQAVQESQAELRVIEQRILGLLPEAQTSFVASNGSSTEIQKFRDEIEKINARIDESAQGTASNRDVSALRTAIEQLSTRVAQGIDNRPLADMDRRILDITQRLEQAQAASRDMPQFNDLERRMAELDHKLNAAIENRGAGATNEALEEKLAEVQDRLGRTEHQLSHLETIEKAISQLYDSMEKNRSWTEQVAEDAARRMGQHIMSQPLGAMSLTGSPEIHALEQGLNAVREASQHADSRNQETLEAVHETLEQIVTKLADLETAAIGQRLVEAAAPAAVHQAVYETAINAPAPQSEPFSFEPPPVPEPEYVEEHAPDSAPEPLNVFSAEPQAITNPFADEPATSSNQFDAVAQSARATDELGTASLGEVDFVAAARRAQQAAIEQKSSSMLGGFSAGKTRLGNNDAKKLKSFKMPFMKGKSVTKLNAGMAEVKLPPEIKPAKNNAGAKRTHLILMGLAVLALVSGVMVKNFTSGHAPLAPIATPAAIAKPATPVIPAAPKAIAPAAPKPAALAPATEQRSDNTTASGTDEILTGSLPTAFSPAAPKSIALEEAIGTSKLREAASIGDANAQFVIATRYLNGENVAIDYSKAAYWYGKAAASGLAPAQYRVATLYERGKGVAKDMRAALGWYERAGALGNVKAMHNAAVISAGNEAGGPDFKRAYKWFSLAAAHGLKDSEFNLAVLIERGLGTKADPAEALFWYSAAAAQQDQDAQAHVETLTKTVSPVIAATVKTRLQNWVPDKAPDAANVVAINNSAWNDGERKQQQSALETKDPIATAQGLLTKMGFNIGQPDGKMGGRTANAIRLFQLQAGMAVTGQVTPELIAAMQSKTT